MNYRLGLIAVLLLVGANASVAQAQTNRLMTMWWIEPAPPPAGILQLASKELVLKQRLLPNGLVFLGRSVSKAEAGADVSSGTELIEILGGPGPIFCEGKFTAGRRQACFVDANRDSAFESSFQTNTTMPALVTIEGRMPRKLYPLAKPIPYRKADPAKSQLGAFVAIERRNFFNIYGRENFMILFGSNGRQERITDPVSFTSADLPKELRVLGSRFTALSENNGRMQVQVHSAMPRQPFGVLRMVTYR